MNNKEFIEKIQKETSRDIKECIIISDCMQNHFFIGKREKEKILFDLMEKLEINKIDANDIYNIACSIISNEIKNKLKHPFRSKD